MKKLVLFVLIFSFCTDASAQNTPELTSDCISISIGESCTLTWDTGGPSAFISGFGKVNPSGSIKISPDYTTDYFLITEDKGEIRSSSINIIVRGQKGISVLPNKEDFTFTVSGEITSCSYLDFLDIVFKTLQDEMKFETHGDYVPKRPYIIFYTDHQEKKELIRPEDKGIRQRRIAYFVEVNEPNKKSIHFEIGTIVEYQRLGESRWHVEKNDKLVRSVAFELKRTLESK